MRKPCAIAFTAFIFVAMTHGQVPHGGNVFFGYSYSGGQVFNPGAIAAPMNGWEASVEGKFLPWLGGVADFDWHYGGARITCAPIGPGCPSLRPRLNGSRHSVMFGPRVSYSFRKYTPFAQFLFGFSHQSDAVGTVSISDMGFSDAAGGGLDYKLIKSVSVRGQADWVRTSLFGGHQNDFRLSAGIVFQF